MKRSPGVMIALLGTDGSGKTTIINHLFDSEIIKSRFGNKIEYYHWRPGFINLPGHNNKSDVTQICKEPHKNKPYNKIVSLGKYLFYNLDYFFGYLFKIKHHLTKGSLIIFDRYYYDYYLDKIRYRLDISNNILNFFLPFIPKPDITFLLVGDASILYERKKELPIEVIQQQIEDLMKYKSYFNNPVVIDVNQPITNVVHTITDKLTALVPEI